MNISENARLATDGNLPIVRTAGAGLARLQTALGRFAAAWTARRRRTREFEELAALSDRELWDLGLSRGDRRAIIDGTYRRE